MCIHKFKRRKDNQDMHTYKQKQRGKVCGAVYTQTKQTWEDKLKCEYTNKNIGR